MSNETDSVPAKPPAIDYSMNDAGKITRTDKDSSVIVAEYDSATKVLTIIPEWAKFRGSVVRWLGETDKGVSNTILKGDKPDKPVEQIPPCPRPNMRDGDKTPEVVEWYRKYRPSEYRARYGIQEMGTVVKTRKVVGPDGKLVDESYTVEALIATRKIHGTEKPDANASGTMGYADIPPDKK